MKATITEYHDCDVFKPGEVWLSPRGFLWKVMNCVPGGQATLRKGMYGDGRIQRRGWDQIGCWVRQSAAGTQPDWTNGTMPTPTQHLECPGALSVLILQAARQALPAHVDSLIDLPDCGKRNQPLMPLLVGLIDAAKVTAGAINDNARDAGPALPRGMADALLNELEIVRQRITSACDAF